MQKQVVLTLILDPKNPDIMYASFWEFRRRLVHQFREERNLTVQVSGYGKS
jgi:hypothetical protein